jgi:hypothetical protein
MDASLEQLSRIKRIADELPGGGVVVTINLEGKGTAP